MTNGVRVAIDHPKRIVADCDRQNNHFNESWWSHVEAGPPDVMLSIGEACAKDPNPKKVDLSAGVYRDETGSPWILPSIRQAEKKLATKNLYREYLPVDGHADFCLNSVKLALGEDSELLAQGKVAMVQGVSGIGALHVWLEFSAKFHRGPSEVWISIPSYGHHEPLLQDFGPVKKYRYYDPHRKCIDFAGLFEDISNIPEGSVILLHPCAHNPSGMDPSPAQWAKISKAIKRAKLFTIFDMAYQGMTSGDLDADAASIRLFARDGHQFGLVQTFSKNMGLYGERVGCLSLVTANYEETIRVTSQLKLIIRNMVSSPPIHGVRIANEVMTDPELKEQWIKDINHMNNRIKAARNLLKYELDKTSTKIDWSHIHTQIGMFFLTGLNPRQVKKMRDEHSVYASVDGRISLSSITSENVKRVARALDEVTKSDDSISIDH